MSLQQLNEQIEEQVRRNANMKQKERTAYAGIVWVRNTDLVVGDRVYDTRASDKFCPVFREIVEIQNKNGEVHLWLEGHTDTKQPFEIPEHFSGDARMWGERECESIGPDDFTPVVWTFEAISREARVFHRFWGVAGKDE